MYEQGKQYEQCRMLVVTLLVLCVMFFPVRDERVERAMGWWWFRLAWLVLLVLVVCVYDDVLLGLLGALLFVMASNVSVVRQVAS